MRRYGLASLLLMLGAGSVHDATALNETRALSFHHTHSGEDLTITFKRDGRYDDDALKKLNHFLRDWRTQDETVMDRRLFDILWEVYRDVDGKQPIQVVSSYRSPATNSMLRRRSAHSGVARHSQHMLGHAMDFYIPNVPLEQIPLRRSFFAIGGDSISAMAVVSRCRSRGITFTVSDIFKHKTITALAQFVSQSTQQITKKDGDGIDRSDEVNVDFSLSPIQQTLAG